MSSRSISCCVLLSILLLESAVVAQGLQFPGPSKEHAFLKRFAGEWKSNSDCNMVPGQPPIKSEAVMRSRMIGPFWIVSEVTGGTKEMPVTAIQTIGFDTKSGKYKGTWIDSMLGHMWHYTGTVSEDGNKLVLEAEGPNFMTGKGTALFRDAYEFKSNDHIVAASYIKDGNGEWIQFITGHSHRVKKKE